MSFNDWSDCLVVRVALGPIPYASEKNKAVHFTINRDARETRSRAHFGTLNSAPFESEELIYARLVADTASLSSVGRAPGCSWKFQTSQQTPGCPQFKSGSGDHFRWLVRIDFDVEFVIGQMSNLMDNSSEVQCH